ncbi:MAG: protein translocase subunit SecF [Deltaproteobacteria bacterium]|nr:protein translocase subunit SecF [Deltaproteobacteria bacterium]
MSEHKFRYLLQPGSNFAFVAKFKAWMIFSIIAILAVIAVLFVNKSVRGDYMNWTIDFKGGTEIIVAFKDNAGNYTKADPGTVREILEKEDTSTEVSDISWSAEDKDGKDITVNGMLIRTTRFTALSPETAKAVVEDFSTTFKDRDVSKATWSGDRLSVRSKKSITPDQAEALFSKHSLELKKWNEEETKQYTSADEGSGEYNQWFAIYGLDRVYEHALEKSLTGTDVNVVQSYGVGAKAGDKLRNDAAKSIVYALFLIMLYLAFRFDIRYAPGAAFATIHDAVMVIGVFAVTWTEVSLVSVAGLLTVMGFSVNDTVIMFDRVRENQAKLKDKKIERIVDISINEMLVRTILTSCTVFATTLVMNIFGAGIVKNFAFAMNVGVIVGVYSSIFLALPFFMFISKKWYSGPAPARRRLGATPAAVDAKPEVESKPDPDEE